MGTTEHPHLSINNSAELPCELAELQVKAQAAETELIAQATFTSRAEYMTRDVALADYNRRVSRLARSCDGNVRDVIYTHASAANGETGQHFFRWQTLARKHNQLHPKRPLSTERIRRISYGLRKLGVLEIEERRQGRYDRKPNAQQSNLFTVHVGLAVVQGELVHHDFNAPLPDVEIPAARQTCENCSDAFDAKRADARYCSSRCRKAANRAADLQVVTDNDQRDDHRADQRDDHRADQRDDHRADHHNSLELQENIRKNVQSSSPLRGAGDDEIQRPDDLSGEELPGSASVGVEVASQPKSPRPVAKASSAPREDRGAAEKAIVRLNEMLPDEMQLTPALGWKPIAAWLKTYKVEDMVDAIRWRLDGDEYAGEFYVSLDANSRQGVLISQLGLLAEEWLAFRTEHDVRSWDEYDERVRPAREAARAAEESAQAEVARNREGYEQTRREQEEKRAAWEAEQAARRAEREAAERATQDEKQAKRAQLEEEIRSLIPTYAGWWHDRPADVALKLATDEIEKKIRRQSRPGWNNTLEHTLKDVKEGIQSLEDYLKKKDAGLVDY